MGTPLLQLELAQLTLRQREMGKSQLVTVGEESLRPGGESCGVGGSVTVFVIVPFQADSESEIPAGSCSRDGFAGGRYRIPDTREGEQPVHTPGWQPGSNLRAGLSQHLPTVFEKQGVHRTTSHVVEHEPL